MSNYEIRNGSTVLSSPKPLEEAREALEMLKGIYPNAKLYATDAVVVKPQFILTAPPEEVEDVGCAGGACTL